MFNRQAILQQAGVYDSFYLYDESKILEYTGQLLRDFTDVTFLYSMKTNAHPLVARSVLSQGFGVDAASLAEVLMGVENGVPRENIQYSAPGKTLSDIRAAIAKSTLIADSLHEIHRIQQVAEELGMQVEIGVRINPDFSFAGGAGGPSKFGVDEQQFFDAAPQLKELQNITVTGLHVHLRSQELHAAVLEAYYERLFALAAAFRDVMGYPLGFINLGSGLGIPYSPQDTPLDTASLGKKVSGLMAQCKAALPGIRVYIETGRFAVGKSGVYATKVLDKKVSHGKTFAILSNTLNGFLRPCIAQLVLHYAGEAQPAGTEPLFTCADAFSFVALTDETKLEQVTLVGNLCTAADVVARDILLPRLTPGDIVVITNAGAYAAVLSPMQFSSQPPPAQLFLTRDGNIVNAQA